MKTVITASGDHLDAPFDWRFGRAAWFCVYDEDAHTATFVENANVSSGRDAGEKAAEMMIRLNVEKVISGDFGLLAEATLDASDIQMAILADPDLTVGDIINRLNSAGV